MFDKLRDLGFEVEFTSHAEAIILHDFPELVGELEGALEQTTIPITEIIGGGGGEAKVTQRLRRSLAAMDWTKHNFELKKTVDGVPKESISHEIDHVRRGDSGVFALEIEWNNKDPFFDRDLENFQRLHAQSAISVGILVTRGAALQSEMVKIVEWAVRSEGIEDAAALEGWGMKERTARQQKMIAAALSAGLDFPSAFARSFVSDKYGQATTHWDKLDARVRRGVGNPCPLLLVGLPLSAVEDYSAATPEL